MNNRLVTIFLFSIFSLFSCSQKIIKNERKLASFTVGENILEVTHPTCVLALSGITPFSDKSLQMLVQGIAIKKGYKQIVMIDKEEEYDEPHLRLNFSVESRIQVFHFYGEDAGGKSINKEITSGVVPEDHLMDFIPLCYLSR